MRKPSSYKPLNIWLLVYRLMKGVYLISKSFQKQSQYRRVVAKEPGEKRVCHYYD